MDCGACKIVQLDQLGGLRIGGRELVERFMHREKVFRRVRGRRALAVRLLTPESAPVPQSVLAAGILDEDPAIGSAAAAKKWPRFCQRSSSAGPATQVGLVN